MYEGAYLLGTSIARPLIAKRQIEIEKKYGEYAVYNGCGGCMLVVMRRRTCVALGASSAASGVYKRQVRLRRSLVGKWPMVVGGWGGGQDQPLPDRPAVGCS